MTVNGYPTLRMFVPFIPDHSKCIKYMSLQNTIKDIITKIFVHQMHQIIKKHNPKIVAIVGSVGKTSTKIATATVLKQQYRVMYQDGNYNTPISLPFIFLGRSLPALKNPFGWMAAWLSGQKIVWGKYPYDVVVVELGTDKPGDILDFKKILHPDISVITAISPEHMQLFGTLDAVAKEELGVVQFSDAIVYNADDIAPEYIATYIGDNPTAYSYGYGDAQYKIASKQDGLGYIMDVVNTGGFRVGAYVDLVAQHSLKAVAAAVVVAKLLDIETKKIEKGMASVQQPAGRMRLLRGIENSTILDDTYNASPLAVAAALHTLYEKSASQKIVLLGNMNELGDTSQASHEEIARLCDATQLDLVVTLGPDANKYISPIAESLGCRVVTSNTPYEAAALITDNLKDGALVLCKGSQNGVFAEETVKMLLANPEDASNLVRQSKFWLAKKEAAFKITK